jgi:hypothetical protein
MTLNIKVLEGEIKNAFLIFERNWLRRRLSTEAEYTSAAVRSSCSRYIKVGSTISSSHGSDFTFPIWIIVLQITQAVDPNVTQSKISGHHDRLL